MKKSLIVSLVMLLAATSAFSQTEIRLWPEGKMPNSKGMELRDSIAQNRLYQVGYPRLYAYPAPAGKNTGAAVLFVPGGGYVRLPAEYGPEDSIAKFYNDMGINVFILCHRLPSSPDLIEREKGPWQDGQRAMRIIRARAAEWGVDTTEEKRAAYSNELHISERTPPTFFVHADNDRTVTPLNSVAFYQGLKARGISASLHIFPYGGHGFDVARAPGSTRLWTDICREWLIEMKIVPQP